jgi:hypothetical protein
MEAYRDRCSGGGASSESIVAPGLSSSAQNSATQECTGCVGTAPGQIVLPAESPNTRS